MILVISDPSDIHLEPVLEHLRRRSVGFVIYDPASYPTASIITMSGPASRRASIRWDGRSTDLSSVRSVWYRRPGEPEFAPGLDDAEASWLRTETSHLLRGLWKTLDAVWVNPPAAIREASLKLHQLRVAADLGFDVPHYVVTNDPDEARSFLDSSPGDVVVKVLSAPGLASTAGAARLFTHVVTRADRTELDSVRFGPAFLQRFVPKSMDIRVTVIGERVFAVGMDPSGAPDAHEDFRRADVFDIAHLPMDLPTGLAALCCRLVRSLGLRFGAIDLLGTPAGGFVFLEINPNGQWLWLERMTGLPLSSALADLLCAREPLP